MWQMPGTSRFFLMNPASREAPSAAACGASRAPLATWPPKTRRAARPQRVQAAWPAIGLGIHRSNVTVQSAQ
jgi:hypothetical protein